MSWRKYKCVWMHLKLEKRIKFERHLNPFWKSNWIIYGKTTNVVMNFVFGPFLWHKEFSKKFRTLSHEDVDDSVEQWSMKLGENDYPTLPHLIESFMDLKGAHVIPHLFEEAPDFQSSIKDYVFVGCTSSYWVYKRLTMR